MRTWWCNPTSNRPLYWNKNGR